MVKLYSDGAQDFDPVFLEPPYQQNILQAFLSVCFVLAASCFQMSYV